MKILLACEESQTTTIELRKLGHEAYSADIQEPSGGHPEWHILGDVLPLLNGRCEFKTMDGELHEIADRWDMIIAHPPCTYFSRAGMANFSKNRPKEYREARYKNFLNLMNFSKNSKMQIAIKLQLKIR